MIQDLEATISKLAIGTQTEALVPRLYNTIARYALEVARDLKQTEWQSKFNGAINAGYILCLMGETARGIEFIDKSLQLYQEKRNSRLGSDVLEPVVGALEAFNVDPSVVKQYKSQLEQAKEKEKNKPGNLRRKIVHIEADLECTVGDLDEAYSKGRREQGLLYQKLNEHGQAIAYFQQSMEEDRRDWGSETSIKNKLSIVDSYLALNDNPSAVKEFMNLMQKLVPSELKLGDGMPRTFVENFSQFVPYFERLGLGENLETVANFARARIEKLQGILQASTKKDDTHLKQMELCSLSRIAASYHVSRGQYQQASDIYDMAREHLKYKDHLSRRDQAEFAIRANNLAKARQLIREDESERDEFGREEGKTFEIANLYLQLGEITPALDILDNHCEHYKTRLIVGSYGGIFDVRRTQVAIFRAIMGDGFMKSKDTSSVKFDLFPRELIFLPDAKDK